MMDVALRQATLVDCDLLAAMNRELIRDEGSRNPMSIGELSDRMYRWLQGDWQATLILTGRVVVGYALYQIRPDEYHPGTNRSVSAAVFCTRCISWAGNR